ncbi:MAG: hypothetical protein ABIJ34_00865 [archaeon]
MKRLLTFILLFTLLASIALAVEAPGINITLMNQEPDPVNPGEYLELRFMIHNTQADTVATNFQVMLDPEYPFSLDANEEALRSYGDLPALGNSKNALVVKYKVRVDEKAVQGSNPVRIKYKHGNLPWISREFFVEVRTRDANLGIVSVTTDPKEIKPGEEVTLNVKVKNMADSALKDVTLKLDLTYSTALGSLTSTAADKIVAFNALPFAPLGSATEQKIYSLSPGEEYTYSYKLIALSDAESMIYKMPIVMTYSDEIGTEYSKNDIIGVIVGAKPDLSVIIDQSDLYVGKKTGTVTIKFINKGFTDVKFLDVKLAEKEEYEILSATEVYIGNVNSDDYETADFDLYLKNGATKQEETIVLPLTVEYRDANNRIYNDVINLDLKVMNPEKLGIKQNNNSFGLIVIFVIGAGIFLYLKRKKKK